MSKWGDRSPPKFPHAGYNNGGDGALGYSVAFASMAKNSAGDIYKNGAKKPFEEKVKVAQMWIGMTRAYPHNNQPSICMLANPA